jgi:hypothetical protein
MNLHKQALFVVLAVGALALVYNALSIVNGSPGLAMLSQSPYGQELAQYPF